MVPSLFNLITTSIAGFFATTAPEVKVETIYNALSTGGFPESGQVFDKVCGGTERTVCVEFTNSQFVAGSIPIRFPTLYESWDNVIHYVYTTPVIKSVSSGIEYSHDTYLRSQGAYKASKETYKVTIDRNITCISESGGRTSLAYTFIAVGEWLTHGHTSDYGNKESHHAVVGVHGRMNVMNCMETPSDTYEGSTDVFADMPALELSEEAPLIGADATEA